MANVIPFNGILYNTDKIGKMADVVAPPYDVISSEEQQELHDRHKNNIVRLILGQKKPDDNDTNNPHTRAANYFRQWSEDGVFIKDEKPCLYLEASEFKLGGTVLSRLGLIARVKIEPFEKRIIMPHEKTFSKVKAERLGLVKSSQMNFSCIFGLYPDGNNIFAKLSNIIETRKPWTDFLNYDGLRHRLWRIEDPDFHSLVTDSLKDEIIIIADGHHRYETTLNYRNYLSESDPNFNEKHPANYVMTYLSSMKDPGLIVKPTHRMLKTMTLSTLDNLIKAASEYFNINKHGGSQGEMLSTLESCKENIFALCVGQPQQYFTFILKPGVMEKQYASEMESSLRELDVSVLTRLVFMDLLGLTQENMDNTASFGYISDTDKAIDAVRDGRYDAAFILNSTRIDQVRRVAEDGIIMPRKSTFFYPKIVSGLVQNSLKPKSSL